MSPYTRFDQNFNNTNGLLDEASLLNPGNDKQGNVWNKPNKLTRSTSLFTG